MSKKILICDDAAFIRMTLKDILRKNGYENIIEAINGKQAVEQYQKEKPDLVLMDITMPEMDGIQALKAIRKIDSDAAVLMVSDMKAGAVIIECIRSGAKDFISKPFTTEKVLEAVKKVLG